MIVRILSYGLAAHLIIGWAFFFFVPQTTRDVKTPSVPVQIHIAEKPAARERIPRKPIKEGSGGRAGAQAPAQTSPSSPASSTSPPPPTYSDLLPKAVSGQIALPTPQESGDGSLLPGQHFKPGSSGTTKQKLMIDASILSAALDVPLHARRITAGSEAFLRIVRKGEGQLTIVDLRGDPMLRAVIFENLLEPRVRTLIVELMNALQENSLLLTLQSRPQASDRVQDETNFTWIGRRLIIRKSAPPQSRAPMGAVTLPDEDAKKAVIRDRLEFERFQRSPAYRAALQNYELPAQP